MAIDGEMRFCGLRQRLKLGNTLDLLGCDPLMMATLLATLSVGFVQDSTATGASLGWVTSLDSGMSNTALRQEPVSVGSFPWTLVRPTQYVQFSLFVARSLKLLGSWHAVWLFAVAVRFIARV